MEPARSIRILADAEIEAANDYVCGTGMLEGAPYLKMNICRF
jgi:hypothetical protein